MQRHEACLFDSYHMIISLLGSDRNVPSDLCQSKPLSLDINNCKMAKIKAGKSYILICHHSSKSSSTLILSGHLPIMNAPLFSW